MRAIVKLIFTLLISFNCHAQYTFEKIYTPSLNQYGRQIFQTSDNGFILQGTIEQGSKNCYIIKTNEYGDTLWTRTYGTDSIQFFAYDMTSTPDGGYLICGDYQNYLTFPSMDSYVQKIDSMGNQVWFSLFGWPTSQNGNKDYAELVKTLDDGSIIIEGTTRDYYVDTGNYISVGLGWRSYVAKFDASGNLNMIRTVSIVLDTLWGLDYQASDIETIGNKLFWLGSTNPGFPPSASTTLIAFDSNLDTLFTITGSLNDYYGLSRSGDEHLFLFGQGIITKMDTA